MKTRYLPLLLCAVLTVCIAPRIRAATTVQYTYDALGRLTSVQYDSGDPLGSIGYTYDSVGNIQVTTLNASAPGGDVNFDGSVGLADAVLALQAVVGQTVPELNISADINDDNRIGMSEAIYTLMQAAAQ